MSTGLKDDGERGHSGLDDATAPDKRNPLLRRSRAFKRHKSMNQQNQRLDASATGRRFLRSAFALLLPLAFFCGCATSNHPQPNQFPFKATDWHGFESVEFTRDFRLGDYDQLAMEHFDTNSTKLPPPDENTHKIAVIFAERADGIFYNALRDKMKGRLQILPRLPDPPVPDRTLVFRGKIVEVDPGSAALRFWVGMGAGLPRVQISGEFADAKTGEVLIRFERARVGPLNKADYEGGLNHCIEALGNDMPYLLDVFKTK